MTKPKELIREAYRVIRRDGFITMFYMTIRHFYINHIRDHTPVIAAPTRAKFDVEIKQGWRHRKLFDPLFGINEDIHDGELGLILAERALAQKGDHVVIIGAGAGISATAAAKQIGPDGKLTLYEGLDRRNQITETFALNDVDEDIDVEIHNTLVGAEETGVDNLYTADEATETINPEELPECDVLECDCNGAELEILRNMEIRPRVLVIELEAVWYKRKFGGEKHPHEVTDHMREMGYRIVRRTGHAGTPITQEELSVLIEKGFELGEEGHDFQIDGATGSPIVCAIRCGPETE